MEAYTYTAQKEVSTEGQFDKNAYSALKKAALEKRNAIRKERKELTKAQKD